MKKNTPQRRVLRLFLKQCLFFITGMDFIHYDDRIGKIDQLLIIGIFPADFIFHSTCYDPHDVMVADQVLYFVSHGKPVIAQTQSGPVTIVGYDEYNVYLMDPGGTEWYYSGMNDSTAMFESAGNVFISYIG